jgi:uncharacterized repeat protein (TIGR01451 family)
MRTGFVRHTAYLGLALIASVAGCHDKLTAPQGSSLHQVEGRVARAVAVDLVVEVTGPAGAKVGEAVVYTVTLTNATADLIATNVQFTFTGTGWGFQTYAPYGGGCGYGGGGSSISGSCAVGALAGGESRTYTFTGRAPAVGTATFTATATSDVEEVDAVNNTATASTPITASADLAVTKTGPAQVLRGNVFAYDIVVRNDGAVASAGVTVTDMMPIRRYNMVVQSATPSVGSCAVAAVQDPAVNYVALRDQVTCDLGPMAAGGSATVQIMVLYSTNTNETGAYTNTVRVAGSDGEMNAGNNAASLTQMFAPADVALSLTGPATGLTGEPQTYVLTVANQGPDETYGNASVTITGANVVSIDEGTANCYQPTSTRVSCAWSLDATASKTVTLVLVRSTAGTISLSGTTATTISGIDPNPSNNSVSTSTTIQSPTPVVALSGPTSVSEGATPTYTFSVTAAGGSFTASVTSCGSAGTMVAGSLQADAGGGSFQCTFGDGPATSAVSVSVNDPSYNTTGSATRSVNVANVAPTAALHQPTTTLFEGSMFGLTLDDAADVAADLPTLQFAFDCGSGSGYGAYSSAPATTCSAPDNATHSVRGKVRDKDGAEHEYVGTVTIANVAPLLDAIVLPLSPVAIGSAVTASAAFTDPGMLDSHAGMVRWDSDLAFMPADAIATGNRTVVASSSALSAGVYTVSMTVRDNDGAESTRTAAGFVVVYDPNASNVSGGGWIWSPTGACALTAVCTEAAGRATFGFTSRYRQGATLPSGNTEFQFQAGGLHFASSLYQWLVVAGSRAQFKGEGTLNGVGRYGFLVTAIDGQTLGGGGTDRFRIKIWDLTNDMVVYDNHRGSSEDSNDATALGGGNIVIHAR